MVVPLDAIEWHHDRTLDVTEWCEKLQTRRYGMILCHSAPLSGTTTAHSMSPSGAAAGFAHLWYWNVWVLPSEKVSTKLPSSCLVQLPDVALASPWKVPALRESATAAASEDEILPVLKVPSSSTFIHIRAKSPPTASHSHPWSTSPKSL